MLHRAALVVLYTLAVVAFISIMLGFNLGLRTLGEWGGPDFQSGMAVGALIMGAIFAFVYLVDRYTSERRDS